MVILYKFPRKVMGGRSFRAAVVEREARTERLVLLLNELHRFCHVVERHRVLAEEGRIAGATGGGAAGGDESKTVKREDGGGREVKEEEGAVSMDLDAAPAGDRLAEKAGKRIGEDSEVGRHTTAPEAEVEAEVEASAEAEAQDSAVSEAAVVAEAAAAAAAARAGRAQKQKELKEDATRKRTALQAEMDLLMAKKHDLFNKLKQKVRRQSSAGVVEAMQPLTPQPSLPRESDDPEAWHGPGSQRRPTGRDSAITDEDATPLPPPSYLRRVESAPPLSPYFPRGAGVGVGDDPAGGFGAGDAPTYGGDADHLPRTPVGMGLGTSAGLGMGIEGTSDDAPMHAHGGPGGGNPFPFVPCSMLPPPPANAPPPLPRKPRAEQIQQPLEL